MGEDKRIGGYVKSDVSNTARDAINWLEAAISADERGDAAELERYMRSAMDRANACFALVLSQKKGGRGV